MRAARYLALRQLLHPRLVVERFSDEAGGTHDKLHEDLELEVKRITQSFGAHVGRYGTPFFLTPMIPDCSADGTMHRYLIQACFFL